MTRAEILATLRNAMKATSQAKVHWDGVTEAAEISALGFDSLAVLDLIYDLQQLFKIEFEAQELIGVKTVGDLVTWLEQRIGQ